MGNSFAVPADTIVTINEGVTVDLSMLNVEDITLKGTVINKGTLVLPADFALTDAPENGTVIIGENTFIHDEEKWNCADDTGIAAKALGEGVYVAATYTDGTTTWTSGVLGYSIGAYCASQSTKGGTIVDLAMATAVYGYQAKQFFG